jgi:hypothetical protein
MIYRRVRNRSNTTGATRGAGTSYPSRAPAFTADFSEVRVAWSLVFCVMFCRSLFVLLSFFPWPLYCLPFFDVRLLVTPLASSSFRHFLLKCLYQTRKMRSRVFVLGVGILHLSVPFQILGLFQQCGVFVLFILFHFTSNYLNIFFG